MDAKLYDEIEERLRYVEDPELGVNIVDLGLIYDLNVTDTAIVITMTLTSAACPLTDFIEEQIGQALWDYPQIVHMNWTFTPHWDLSRVTDDGRDQLRALGMNIPVY